MQDCDASSSFQWQESTAAVGWEQLHGWPPDPMWTESNWPPGQPSLQLFQVSLLLLCLQSLLFPSILPWLLVWVWDRGQLLSNTSHSLVLSCLSICL